ncbi:MAG TPA: DUF4266 domain-containing protein [Flavobacterium sp.]|jgi:hypothetical protein|uniref:DUF4266 domain-containing protein n=4 Tax=Flavobacterium TaxID=237 RepID=A0A6V6YZV4_9FLAO|nr:MULTISPECIES: DUF4266 domain-containing protein [Flavobacterium]OOV17613.1 hypothetical protein BXU10_16205 [Flavobacterium sp. LM4]GGF22671.1 hypothetical protein GCM10011518_34880 [Flavobacterium limi]CAD0005078.1 hypothetical protein FLACHUCJ7_02208 [Flavobacterium chungangense]CAD0007227.1 hypothetical protein FLAT13_03722 [Flavobacterium salmonis]
MKNQKQQNLVLLCSIALAGILTSSCTSVKEYQKGKINDSEMVLANRKIEKTELSFQSYREGASGANAGKSGGGCGCN